MRAGGNQLSVLNPWETVVFVEGLETIGLQGVPYESARGSRTNRFAEGKER